MTVLTETLPSAIAVPAAVQHACEAPELPPAIDFGGLPLLPLTKQELLDTLVVRARQKVATTVHYLNAHSFNLVRQDSELYEACSQADLLYADGASVVWAARLLGHTIPGRLTAADYFEEFARACAAASISVFLVGGAAGVADVAAERLTRAVPGLRIAGTSHGYLTSEESTALADRISDSEADVLVVGMGCPRQEQWIRRYGPRTGVPVRWAVGALLDYFAGAEPRAPQWLCRWSGEWFFRFMVDPARRWRRYLAGNLKFGAWLVGEWCRISGTQ